MNEPNRRANDLSYDVIGAAIDVHRALGPCFMESVYENAMAVELELRGIPFKRQVACSVSYKDVVVGEGRIDLLIEDLLVVELKTVDAIVEAHVAQALFYLRTTDLPLALIVNFKANVLREGIRRVVRSR